MINLSGSIMALVVEITLTRINVECFNDRCQKADTGAQ